MAGQTSGRTTRRTTERDQAVDTTATAATGTASATTDATVDAPQRPEPSPRTGVAVNVDVLRTAFATGDASQSVGYVQHVLRSRGFEPGNVSGVADHATRVALARFQESVGQPPTGLPTDHDVDYLGFDVIG